MLRRGSNHSIPFVARGCRGRIIFSKCRDKDHVGAYACIHRDGRRVTIKVNPATWDARPAEGLLHEVLHLACMLPDEKERSLHEKIREKIELTASQIEGIEEIIVEHIDGLLFDLLATNETLLNLLFRASFVEVDE